MKSIIELRHVSRKFVKRHSKVNTFRAYLAGMVLPRRRDRQESFLALDDVCLEIRPGERFAILGHNGAGKSTLLRVVARTLQPSQGQVIVRGKVVPLIQLGLGFDGELTGEENIFLNASMYGLSRAQIREIYPHVVGFSELGDFIDTPLKHYSSGMHARLSFAIAVHLSGEVLIIDEALSAGDLAFNEKSTRKIRELLDSGRTCVAASHNLADVADNFDRACILSHGKVVAVGPADGIVLEYRRLAGFGA